MLDHKPTQKVSGYTKRDLLKAGILGAAGLMIPGVMGTANAARLAIPDGGSFRISFRNAHTGDSFSGTYRVGDRYLPEAFEDINYALRDFRTGEVFPIDPRVIDIIYAVRQKSSSDRPFEVLSGYRSPRTNTMLRSRGGGGVASNSLHLTGQALDVRLPGQSIKGLRDIGVSLRAGGVGYYPRSNFVHFDTGRFRTW